MQTTNTVTLAKFVACWQYQRTICLPWFTFRLMDSLVHLKFVACYQYQRTICLPWVTFRLMDSLIPNGRKIVNSKQTDCMKILFLKLLDIILTQGRRYLIMSIIFFSFWALGQRLWHWIQLLESFTLFQTKVSHQVNWFLWWKCLDWNDFFLGVQSVDTSR